MTDAHDRHDEAEPRKGGFGAFSERYRERWATDHPKPKPAADADPAASEPAGADARDATADDERTNP